MKNNNKAAIELYEFLVEAKNAETKRDAFEARSSQLRDQMILHEQVNKVTDPPNKHAIRLLLVGTFVILLVGYALMRVLFWLALGWLAVLLIGFGSFGRVRRRFFWRYR
jgi:hypothetical protein